MNPRVSETEYYTAVKKAKTKLKKKKGASIF
jgi:hypothetical protein